MGRPIATVLLLLALVGGAWFFYSNEPSTLTSQASEKISPARDLPASVASDSSSNTEPSPTRTVVASAPTTPATANSNTREVRTAILNSPPASGASIGTPNNAAEPIKSDAEIIAEWVSPTGKAGREFDRNKVMHNLLVTEPRDDTWASAAEQQLRNYVTTTMGPRLNLVSVLCGSSLCEFDLVGRSPGNLQADWADEQQYLILMERQPWWNEYQFDEATVAVDSTTDKRALFIAFIPRLKKGASSD